MNSPDRYRFPQGEALELNKPVTAEELALRMIDAFNVPSSKAPATTWRQTDYLAKLGLTDDSTPHPPRRDPAHYIGELCDIIVNSGHYAWAGLIIIDGYDSYLYELEILPKDPTYKNTRLKSAYDHFDKALRELEDNEGTFTVRRLHIKTADEQTYGPDIMERAQIVRDAGNDAFVEFSVDL